uniref:Uncharacterized protein n=1 Tax=Glossina pallidipes TaxID=7398 RepID=A0A1A9ZXV7_GLOPL
MDLYVGIKTSDVAAITYATDKGSNGDKTPFAAMRSNGRGQLWTDSFAFLNQKKKGTMVPNKMISLSDRIFCNTNELRPRLRRSSFISQQLVPLHNLCSQRHREKKKIAEGHNLSHSPQESCKKNSKAFMWGKY